MRLFAMLSFCAALAAPAAAQLSHTIPHGVAAVPGNGSNLFPWGRGAVGPGLRLQCLYDGVNFTAAGIDVPIAISRLRWRADETAAPWLGGTYAAVLVRMCTAANDQSAASTVFSANHGPDLTTVHAGAVVVVPGSSLGAGTLGPVVVDLPLSTPFTYDPTVGDLLIDVDFASTAFGGGTLPFLDVQTTGSASSRVYASTTYGAPTGNFEANHGPVVELEYSLPPGFASFHAFGDGCYSSASSCHETFTGAAFDLGGSATATASIVFLPNAAGGYAVAAGTAPFRAPSSPDLLLPDNGLSASQSLGFALPFPGGSASAVRLCSNGFVWLDPAQTSADASPTSAELLSQAARIAPFWCDLNPAATSGGQRVGSIHFEVDTATGAAYCTWRNVPEAGTGNIGNTSTFQVALFPSGSFEFRYQACTLSAARELVVGQSTLPAARDPGNRDLSAAMPFSTFADGFPLRLLASARPVTGTTIDLRTTDVPAGTGFGLLLFAFTAVQPPLPLGAIGMPGCFQHVALGGTLPLFPAGASVSLPLSIPAGSALAGVRIQYQSAVFANGRNALGAISSNGLELLFAGN
jgi:hypothetical protein